MNPPEDEQGEKPLADIATLPPEGILIIDSTSNAGITRARIDELIDEEIVTLGRSPEVRR